MRRSAHSNQISECLLGHFTDTGCLNGVSRQTRRRGQPQILTNVPWHVWKFACHLSSSDVWRITCSHHSLFYVRRQTCTVKPTLTAVGIIVMFIHCSVAESLWWGGVQHRDLTTRCLNGKMFLHFSNHHTSVLESCSPAHIQMPTLLPEKHMQKGQYGAAMSGCNKSNLITCKWQCGQSVIRIRFWETNQICL